MKNKGREMVSFLQILNPKGGDNNETEWKRTQKRTEEIQEILKVLSEFLW